MDYNINGPVGIPPSPDFDVQDAGKRVNRSGLALFAWIIIATVAMVVVLVVLKNLFPKGDEDYMVAIVNLVGLYGIGAPLAYLVFRTVKAEPAQQRSMTFLVFLKFTLVAFALMIAGVMVGNVVNGVITNVTGFEQENAVEETLEGSAVWLNLVYALILAPVMEEVFFRKLLIDRISPLGQRMCILISGVAFGVFHGNIAQFCYATLTGMLLAYIYYNTRKIGYCMGIHAILNFVGGGLPTLISYVVNPAFFSENLTDEAYFQLVENNPVEYLIIIGTTFLPYVLALVGMIILLISFKNLISYIEPCPIPREKRWKVVLLNPGAILFLLYNVMSMILYIFLP